MICSFEEMISSPWNSLEARQAREEGLRFCGKKHRAFVRLSKLSPGTQALLIRVDGDEALQKRIIQEGLFPGDFVEILPLPERFHDNFIRLRWDCQEITIPKKDGAHLLACPFSTKKDVRQSSSGKRFSAGLPERSSLYRKLLCFFFQKKRGSSSR